MLKNDISLRERSKKLSRAISSVSSEVILGGGIKKYNPVLANKRSIKKELLSGLRQERKYRRKQRRGTKAKRSLENMLYIHERPKEVEDRIIPGHWEGDLILQK